MTDKKPRWRIFLSGRGRSKDSSLSSPISWNYLPIEQIGPGDFIELKIKAPSPESPYYISSDLTDHVISFFQEDQDEKKRFADAARTFINNSKYSRDWGWEYSVRVTDGGMEIWRKE